MIHHIIALYIYYTHIAYCIKYYRNIPKAIYISIPLVTVCYLLVNVAYLTIMSPDEIVRNEAVAVVSIQYYHL